MTNLQQWSQHPLYRQLTEVFSTPEGNLLEVTDYATAQAQIDFFRYALLKSRPRKVMETGTNKGLFGFALFHLISEEALPPVRLYTFDINEKSAECIRLLNQSQNVVRSQFFHGDTKQTLLHFHEPNIDLAWIDGGHDDATAYSDLSHAIRLGIPYIAVDDIKTFPYSPDDPGAPHLAAVVSRILQEHPKYKQIPNPFYDRDSRGAILLTSRG